MTRTLFLRLRDIGHAEPQAEWRLYDGQGARLSGSARPQALGDVAAELPEGEYRTVVLLPGQHVLVSQARVAGQHVKHLRSAVAHAIEEQLAESADEVHLAVGNDAADAGGARFYSCAVIDGALMRRLTESLEEAGLAADVATPEALLLPCPPGRGAILLEGRQVIFRLAPALASGMEVDMFAPFMKNYLARPDIPQAEQPAQMRPDAIDLWTADAEQAAAVRGVCGGMAVTQHALPAPAFDWLCGRWFAGGAADAINLLQGPYRKRGQGLAVPWKPAALILASWLAIQLAFTAGMTAYFNHRGDALHAASEAIYRRLYPQDGKIVDIRAQAEQHLREMPADVAPTGLLALLGAAAANPQMRELEVSALSYDADKGELAITARANDAAVFDRFRQAQAQGYGIDIGAVTRQGAAAQAVITMREKQP